MKKILTFLLLAAMTAAFAQGARPNHQKKRMPPKHPLMAALDSHNFKPEERERLRALASKDMKAFVQEMRKHYMKHRKEQALKTLALRKAVLDAKTPEEKEKAKAALREDLRKKADSRLAFHKRILDETERNLRMMQERCKKLQAQYDERLKNKEQSIEKELEQLLSGEPPKRLIQQANWDPEKPLPFPKKKR